MKVLLFVALLIDDRIPPVVFNCPSDFEVRREAGQSSVFVTWDEPYATDNSGQAPLVSRNVAPDFYASGNYIFNVIYRYTDQAGLVADCRFAITVLYCKINSYILGSLLWKIPIIVHIYSVRSSFW